MNYPFVLTMCAGQAGVEARSTVGYTMADRARAAKLSVADVERELVGGECAYWACIPSKAMLRPVVAVADACRVSGARQAVTGTVDAMAVFARRDEWVSNWDDEGQARGLKTLGADLIRGHGRLDGHRRVAVATADGEAVALSARHAVVICTGSRPAFPELADLAESRPWTNRDATGSRTVPGRLAIVGGGGVGVEMASAWACLGSAVTLLAQADGLLPRMEPFVGELVGCALAVTFGGKWQGIFGAIWPGGLVRVVGFGHAEALALAAAVQP